MARPDEVEVATVYAPSTVGPYLWHEFSLAQVERDFDAIARARLSTVRVHLSWDAFMPTDRAVSPRRMRELESLLGAARERSLRVVPVLFVQTLGDCVMLPSWAVNAGEPRHGVRVLTDGRPARGGARDAWSDPLMQEAEVRWLDAMLAAFAGHPAVAAWDLGHDPATTVRPRRIAHVTSWLELLASRVREQGEQCRLTLGQDDVTVGRAMRPHLIAPHVDRLAVAVHPHHLAVPGELLDPERVAFLAWVLRRLTVDAVPLHVQLDVAVAPAADDGTVVEGTFDDVLATRRGIDGMLRRLVESGMCGVTSAAWSDGGPRVHAAPPSDRDPAWPWRGIVDSTGDSKETMTPWLHLAADAPAVRWGRLPAPVLDADDWYQNLPDSLRDVHASWQGGRGESDVIL